LNRERLAAALLLACAVLPLLARVQAVVATGRAAYCQEETDFSVERGDALLHGVPLPGAAWAMPFYSIPNAYLCSRLPRPAAAEAHSAVLLAGAAAVFALGALLYSPVCGAAAVLLYAHLPPGAAEDTRWLYILTVLLAAYFLARRARAPTLANGLLLGAACGASLLVLSPLFLFPFVLVVYERTRDPKARERRPLDAAALCLLPLLFLVPWIVMNWRLTGRFVPFEDGRADDNVILGALGFVRTMGLEDTRRLAGLSPASGSALWWAVREILRHPLRFAAAVPARAALAFRPHWALALAAACSVWLARRREDARQLALLAGYFFAIHLLMPVQDSYFDPAWPLLAVLAAGLLAAWTRPSARRWNAAGAAPVYAAFALLLLAEAGALAAAWTYPARSRQPGALERELARDPADPWLWSRRGELRLSAGRPKEAADDLGRALALDPQKDREVRYDWALLASGAPGAWVWEDLQPGPDRMLVNVRIRVLRAIYRLDRGRRAQADAEMSSLLADAETQGTSNSLRPVVLEVLSSWPAPKRAPLIEFLESAPGLGRALGADAWTGAWLELARAELAAGRADAARRALAAAERAGLSDERRLRAAEDDPGDGTFAALVLEGLRDKQPAQAARLVSLAEAASKSGRDAKAVRLLALAESSFPLDPGQARRAALVDWDSGAPQRAVALLKKLKLDSPAEADRILDMASRPAPRPRVLDLLEIVEDMRLDAERTERLAKVYDALAEPDRAARVRGRQGDGVRARLEAARAAAAAGDRAAALSSLAAAGRLDLDDDGSRAVMLAYQGLGEYARALEIAERRVRARPSDGEWRSDRGLLRAVRGDREGAVSDWKAALRLDPDLSAPYLSLGSLDASLGRRAEALALYRRALSRPALLRNAEAARLIRAESEKLTGR